MSRTLKPISTFANEADERCFWETHDSTDHVDWSRARPVRLPNLKPTSAAISSRLPITLPGRIKVTANKRDVSYQSLIKTWLALIKTWLAEKVDGA